jgi:hypothetical protein
MFTRIKIKKIGIKTLMILFALTNAVIAASGKNTSYAAIKMPSDIKGHKYESEIKAAVKEGWAYVENGKFKPDKAATLEEVVWMLIGKINLVKPAGYNIEKKADMTKYSDQASIWAEDRMAIAIGNSYMDETPDGKIGAERNITRAEMAVLLGKLIADNVSSEELPFTDETFRPEGIVTKAEAVVMISRWAQSEKSPALTAEDEKRLMGYTQKTGKFYASNEEYKKKASKYVPGYLVVAKDFIELQENYDYREIATKRGKAEYKNAFMKYLIKNYEGSNFKLNKQITGILDNKLVKESFFVTNDNCIYRAGDLCVIVRGIEYYTILSKSKNALKKVETGVEYKMDVEIVLSRNTTENGDNYVVLLTKFLSKSKKV